MLLKKVKAQKGVRKDVAGRVEKGKDCSFQQGIQRKPEAVAFEQSPGGGERVSQATNRGVY